MIMWSEISTVFIAVS